MGHNTGLFYIYIGEGLWQAVVSDGDVTVTTATLPLAIARTRLDPGDTSLRATDYPRTT